METTKIAVFKGKEVRKTIHNNEWWFSITDIIEALTGNERSRKYWNDLKNKLIKEGYSEVSEKIGQLKLQAPDGKQRLIRILIISRAATIRFGISSKAVPA